MFDNPYFTYAGMNNPMGAMPYIVSLSNLNTTESEVNLFNAQENLTASNKGLPDGVVANAELIYEMPFAQTFSCYQNVPFLGFRNETDFSLHNTAGGTLRSFQLQTNLLTGTAKTLAGGYAGVSNPTKYKLDPRRANVSATAEGIGASLRFIFSVTSSEQLGGRDLDEIVVSNTTTFPCTDRFALTKITTGFNNSDSSDASSYTEILSTTNFTPLGIDHILLQSENVAKIGANPILLSVKDATGNRDRKEIALANSPYIRPNQRLISSINDIDGSTELTLTLPPQTILELFLYPTNRMVL
tara:strand:- start:3919 stop:4818 length:900 start_codon:yes stop_codon:yes gene_type:complete